MQPSAMKEGKLTSFWRGRSEDLRPKGNQIFSKGRDSHESFEKAILSIGGEGKLGILDHLTLTLGGKKKTERVTDWHRAGGKKTKCPKRNRAFWYRLPTPKKKPHPQPPSFPRFKLFVGGWILGAPRSLLGGFLDWVGWDGCDRGE